MQDQSTIKGFRLSPQQMRLWTLQQNSAAYRAHCSILLSGLLSVNKLQAAIDEAVSRHEVYRTCLRCMPDSNFPVQVVTERCLFTWRAINLSAANPEEQSLRLEEIAEALKQHPIDLEDGPVLHFALVTVSDHEHILFIHLSAFHADNHSLENLLGAITECYGTDLEEYKLSDTNDIAQHIHFSEWQHTLLDEEESKTGREYWQKLDLSVLSGWSFPYGRRSNAAEAFIPDSFAMPISNDFNTHLSVLMESYDTDDSHFFLACWYILLWRLTGQGQFIIAVGTDGRIFEDQMEIAGPLTKYLPVSCHLSANLRFSEILAQVKQMLDEAYEWQHYWIGAEPFSSAWNDGEHVSGGATRSLSFPFGFDFSHWPAVSVADGVSFSLRECHTYLEPFNIEISAIQKADDTLLLEFHYNTSLFSIEDIQRLADQYYTLLQSALEQPEALLCELEILSEKARTEILVACNAESLFQPAGPVEELWDKPISSIFEEQVERAPEAIAVVFEESFLTYGELNNRANQLAHLLSRSGVGPDVPVGIYMEPSLEMLVGLLGILKAGGAYVPLDRGYPAERLALILEETRPALVLTQDRGKAEALDCSIREIRVGIRRSEEDYPAKIAFGGIVSLSEQCWAHEPCSNPVNPVSPENLAYIIYTSGSTGRPKGVMVRHRSVVNYTLALCELLGVEPGWQYAMVSTLAADLGNTALFCALASGGCVQIPEAEMVTDVPALARWVEQHPIDVLKIVPSHLSALLIGEQAKQLLPRQRLVLGGEAFPLSLLARLQELVETCQVGCKVYNHYGPTETTIGVLVNELVAVPSSGSRKDIDSCHSPTGKVYTPNPNGSSGNALGRLDGLEGEADSHASHQSVPLGSPIANSEIYVLDNRMQLVPIGVAGELYIGGVGLALGYIHQPGMTAERFVPHPFVGIVQTCGAVACMPCATGLHTGYSVDPGTRLYRTGDLARRQADGTIEYLGRIDQQVKLRGYRIELGEIEAILREYPGVREAVVVLHEEDGTQKYLAPATPLLLAYVVVRHTGPELQEELRTHLRKQLPDPMIPSRVVFLETLPLTPNGKVDRKALAAMELAPPTPQSRRRELTKTQLQELLVTLWEEVLHLPQIGIHDNFFALGGHSLLATQMVARICQFFQVDLPLRHLFEAPTIARLSSHLEELVRGAPPSSIPALLPMERPGDLPLSFAQERLWFLDQWNPGSDWYNVPLALRLSGQLNIAALERSLTTLVQRHEVLRTTFEERLGNPVQVIAPIDPVCPTIQIPVIDLRGWGGAERRDGFNAPPLTDLVRAEAGRSFDLASGPLLRVYLLRCEEQEHVLLFTMHHIATDGWSMSVLVREITTLYQAEINEEPGYLPELPVQYADYTLWQRAWLQGELLEEQLAYWRKQLADLSPLILPTDHPRPVVKTDRGASQPRLLPKVMSEALLHLSQKLDVTLFMLLLAGFQVLLMRYTGQTDLSVGTTIANRTRPELEGLIGFFANTLVMRTDLGGNPTFEQLVYRVREVCLQAYVHQDIPFEKVVAELEPARNMGHTPFFQAMIVLHNTPRGNDESLVEMTVEPLALERTTSKFDLTLSLSQTEQGLHCLLEYSTDLFESDTITRMLDHWQTLLTSILQDPQARISDLSLLTGSERESLLVAWNATETDHQGFNPWCPQDLCLHQLFEQQVLRTPNAVALIFGQTTLTYEDLNKRADRLAHHLRTLVFLLTAEVLVGICIQRSPAMIVGLLAVLKADGAYVPLDPKLPQERLQYMIEDAGIALLLTQEHLQDLLPSGGRIVVCLDEQGEVTPHVGTGGFGSPINPLPPRKIPFGSARPSRPSGHGDNLAYVLYTSGSTGRPKGVMVPHRGLVNYLCWAAQTYGTADSNGAPVHSPIGFDLTVTSLFVPLLRGQSVVLLPEDEGVEELATVLSSKERFNLVKVTPSHLEALSELVAAEKLDGGARIWIIGGEALWYESLSFLQSEAGEKVRLINEYGPTETVVGCCVYELPEAAPSGGAVPIGRPIANTQVYVLDQHLQPVPIGVCGELYVAGTGVTRGYLNRPEQTAEYFIPHPWGVEPGARLYRTGDLVHYRRDGVLEFVGRVDQQVKLRGYRIELGEIEAVLRSNATIQESVVVVREEGPCEKELAAYVVPALDAGNTLGWEEEQIEQWQMLYDDMYRTTTDQQDPTFNISGWNSSYTGLPIPAEEMREQIEQAVARILARHPQQVMEIGVGTGMLLFRIAPHTRSYLATDFAADALTYVQQVLATHPIPQVRLVQASADKAIVLPPESVDAVILNSVVQYFPSITYLLRVLEGAFSALQPGGFLFIGDVRSLPLLKAYVTSVELYRAPVTLSRAEVRQRVEQRMLAEEELLIDPAFFLALQREWPQVGQVLLQLKRGHADNELTRYRYDVVIRKGATEEPLGERTLWECGSEVVTYTRIEEYLREQKPEVLQIRHVPNRRLAGDLQAVAWVFGEHGPEMVGDWRDEQETPHVGTGVSSPINPLPPRKTPFGSARPSRPSGHGDNLAPKYLPMKAVSDGEDLDPEALWELGERLGYHVSVSSSSEGEMGKCEVTFIKGTQVKSRPYSTAVSPARTSLSPTRWLSYANNPLQGKMMQTWLPELRQYLQERLPEYMIPAQFVVLESLPLTPNGKVDRRALPVPNRMQMSRDDTFVTPQTRLQEQLAEIWKDVLHLSQVSIHDNFFVLGGHSLLATQVISRIRRAFPVELPLRSLFEDPTIAQLSARLEELIRSSSSASLLPLFPMERPVGSGFTSDLPLSFAQERLWFLNQWEPESAWYNVPMVLRIEGALQVAALERSLARVVQRHEVLRTTFDKRAGRPVQVIANTLPIHLPIIDLRGWATATRDQLVRELARAEAQRPFDLAKGPLLRVYLLQLVLEEHVLLFTLHHIISDGWSMGVLVREMTALYQAEVNGELDGQAQGTVPTLSELPIQYADYTLWQREFLQGAVLEVQMAYWRKQLADLSPLELPTDHPRPAVKTDRGASQSYLLPEAIAQELLQLCQKLDVTLFMLLLATFQVLLMRYTGQSDISVGTPIANRTRAELEGLIGFFVNTLVMRTDLGGDPTFEQVLQSVREVCLQAYAHQDIPFEKVVQELAPVRDTSRSPLFQVAFVLQNTPEEREIAPVLDLAGVRVMPLSMEETTSKFDLILFVLEVAPGLAPGGLNCVLEYSTDLFEAATITHMLAHFQTLLQGIVQDPQTRVSALPLLTDAEREQLLVQWNTTTTGRVVESSSERWQDVCLHEIFEQQVERTPDAVALTFGADKMLTYAELNRHANQLAHYLRHIVGTGVFLANHARSENEKPLSVGATHTSSDGASADRGFSFGCEPLEAQRNPCPYEKPTPEGQAPQGPEFLVGICLERSIEMVVGLLGVLKAGGAYVPLDPSYPREHTAFIVQDAQISILLTQERLLRQIPASAVHVLVLEQMWEAMICQSDQNPATVEVEASHLAYIIYTSGSTGVPKGVQVTHRGLGNLGLAQANTFAIGPGSRVLQFASLNFDASIWEILMALLVGGSLHLEQMERMLPGPDLLQVLQEQAITNVTLPPSVLAMLPTSSSLPALQTLIVAGEACPVELMAHWAPGRHFFNAYGPTEATVCATVAECEASQANQSFLSLGRPAVNTQIYLLDRHLQPVPIGVPGEICLGGVGLARGYLGRPDLTAERFIPHPFVDNPSDPRRDRGFARPSDPSPHEKPLSAPARHTLAGSSEALSLLVHSGERLYRTGDLARYLPDGSMEFLGRIDQQVKIRGYRIELGEIEAVLREHPAIQDSVVLVREIPEGEKRLAPTAKWLVAYPVLQQGHVLTIDDLRSYLQDRLPAHMIPVEFIPLEALPLLPNGKLDRRGLPMSEERLAKGSNVQQEARTPIEDLLVGVFQEVLRRDSASHQSVGIHESFFDLGGHSLLATRLAARIGAILDVSVPVRAVFEAPTVAELAKLAEHLLRKGQEVPIPPLVPMLRPEEIPLSFAQQRLWFLDQLEPGSTAYLAPSAYRLRGELDEQCLQRSLQELMDRHEGLRTTFPQKDAQPIQVIHPSQQQVLYGRSLLPVIDLQGLRPEEKEEQVYCLAKQEVQRPCDLAQGPLLRTYLLRLLRQEHVWLLTLHLIITDGWSNGVLIHELTTLYQANVSGQPSPLAPLPIQYADYALWQRVFLQGEVLEAQLAYWRERLTDVSERGQAPLLQLPTDHPRPAVCRYQGARVERQLSAVLSAELIALSQKEHVTLFMLLLAAFQVLLLRYSGQSDISIGTPIANRRQAELEGLIGFFVNTLVLRSDLAGNPTFVEVLARVREVCLSAYAHQDIPFEKVVEELEPVRDLSQSPLFQVMFVLHNTEHVHDELVGVSVAPLAMESTISKFDLTLSASETALGGLHLALEYHTELFEGETIVRMLAHLLTLLEGIVQDPQTRIADLPLLTEAERYQLLVQWNTESLDETFAQSNYQYPQGLFVHQLFEQQVARTPDAVAVHFEDMQVTYQQLDQRANQLAHHLRARGIGLERHVGLCVQRSLELVVGFLGILKAGAVYVPLDPQYPLQRLAFLIENAQVEVILTQQRLQGRLPLQSVPVMYLDRDWSIIATNAADTPSCINSSLSLAYVIYTSGSTGQPKGAMITHQGFGNVITASTQAFAITPETRLLQHASMSFDNSIWEMFMALTSGAVLCLGMQETMFSGADLGHFLHRQAITTAILTPSVLAMVPYEPYPALQTLMVGGESCSVELVIRWSSDRRFFNTYGPTETSIHATLKEYTQQEDVLTISMGRPNKNIETYVLDSHLQPVPIGVPGELYIGGIGVARGYLSNPELTAQFFVPHPFVGTGLAPHSSVGTGLAPVRSGARLYRTGDLARLLPSGDLQFLGRVDQQVKIHGIRIEPGEIEAALCTYSLVKEAVVLVEQETTGHPRLVAFVVSSSTYPLSASELRRYLLQRLPAHMIPSAFVQLAALPLTSNGKVDRRTLLALEKVQSEESVALEGARTPIEELLVGIFCEVLGRRRDSASRLSVGIHDNFFELGGHSLLATRLIAQVRAMLGVEMPLRAVFETPTVAELAKLAEHLLRKGQEVLIPPLVPMERPKELPLSFAQQRLWFLDQLEPESTVYLVPSANRLHGELDVLCLQRSLQELMDRHESLRTTFSQRDGQAMQVIHPIVSVPSSGSRKDIGSCRPTRGKVYPPKPNGSSGNAVGTYPSGRPLLPIIDLQGLRPEEKEEQVGSLIGQEAQRPCDLAQGPLLRTYLLRLLRQEHVWLLTLHHIVTDGWSNGVLIHELTTLYQANVSGQPSPLAPLPIQYADYALWQWEFLQGEVLEAQLAYWRKRLANVSGRGQVPPLQLPTDHPRPAVRRYRGAREQRRLPAALSAELIALSQKEHMTLFMLLLAAFQVLLLRYSGQSDISVGTPIANRGQAELEGLIGFFVNTLVMRTDLSGDPTFLEVLKQVREVALEAYAHQDVPFEKIVDELQPERDLSRSALFQVMFVLQNAPLPVELPEMGQVPIRIEPLEVETTTSKFDLTLSCEENSSTTETGLHCSLVYNTDLFEAQTITRMLTNFQTLLEGIVQDPQTHVSVLPLLTEGEREQVLAQGTGEWSTTQTSYPQDLCVHQLFEQQAERVPDAVAVAFVEDEMLTYAELNRRTNQLAHYLQEQGVGPDKLVGICMDRCMELVIGVLAVLKAGGAYVPIDPSYPKERLAYLLADSQVRILLTQPHLLEVLPHHQAQTLCVSEILQMLQEQSEFQQFVPLQLDPQQLAYLIYTSGSTGQPKGVMNSHRALRNHLFWFCRRFALGEQDRVLLTASFSFDAFVCGFFASLASGARLVLAQLGGEKDPAYLREVIEREAITILHFVPSMLQLFLSEWRKGIEGHTRSSVLRHVLVGGEVLPYTLQKRFWEQSGAALHNLYGPTETTIHATHWECEQRDEQSRVPIGRPIDNIQTYILDEQMQVVPIGVPGELYIGGIGVVCGYYDRPELTAERFVPHPFVRAGQGSSSSADPEPGARLYRTGDLVRYLPDGNIEYLGRLDQQVKLRGYRIEVAEIEAVLRRHPNVHDSVVVLREDPETLPHLVGHVVPRQQPAPVDMNLGDFLREHLPEYMVPSTFVYLKFLPLTPNGKVNRQQLAKAQMDSLSDNTALSSLVELESPSKTVVQPRDAIEWQLLQIWTEILPPQRQPLSVIDDFFKLGGHSLLAVRLMSHIVKHFGRDLPLTTLFRYPTVAMLAAVLRQHNPSEEHSPLAAIQTQGTRPPFFCVHPSGGTAFCYVNLARRLGPDQPFYGLHIPDRSTVEEELGTVEEMAAHYLAAIQSVQPQGPYLLGGWSSGGIIAFEMAQQLQRQGYEVGLLALLDSGPPNAQMREKALKEGMDLGDVAVVEELISPYKITVPADLAPDEQLKYAIEQMKMLHVIPADASIEVVRRHARTSILNKHLVNLYGAQTYPYQIDYFACSQWVGPDEDNRVGTEVNPVPTHREMQLQRWRELANGGMEVHLVPGNHLSMVEEPHVQGLADALKQSIERACERKRYSD